MAFIVWTMMLPEMQECVRRLCSPLSAANLAMTSHHEAAQRQHYYEMTPSGCKDMPRYFSFVAREGDDAHLLHTFQQLVQDGGAAEDDDGWIRCITLLKKALKHQRDAIVMHAITSVWGPGDAPLHDCKRLTYHFNDRVTACRFVKWLVPGDEFAKFWYDVSAYWYVRTTRDTRTLKSWRSSVFSLSDWAARTNDEALMHALGHEFVPMSSCMARHASVAFLNAAVAAGWDPSDFGDPANFFAPDITLDKVQWAASHGFWPASEDVELWSADEDDDDDPDETPFDDPHVARICFGFRDPRITEWLARHLGYDEDRLRELWVACARATSRFYFAGAPDAIRFLEHFGFGWSAALLSQAFFHDDVGAVRWYLTRPDRFIPSDCAKVSTIYDADDTMLDWLDAHGWLGAKNADGFSHILHATTRQELSLLVADGDRASETLLPLLV